MITSVLTSVGEEKLNTVYFSKLNYHKIATHKNYAQFPTLKIKLFIEN
jgi:hypothetical protein